MKKFLLLLCLIFIAFFYQSTLLAQPKVNLQEKAFYQNLYSRLTTDIRRNIDRATRNRFPNQMKPENFLKTDFNSITFFKQRPTLLENINNIKLKYNLEIKDYQLKNTAQPEQKQEIQPIQKKQPKLPQRDEKEVHLSSFLFNELSLEGKAGIDYFYIDPGVLMPKNKEIEINSNPYLYYDIKLKADLNFLGFDFRFKNTFKGDNYKDNYVNKQTTMENVKDAETRERLFNIVGYLSPIAYGNNRTMGIYAFGEYRVFQTEAKIKTAIPFKDKNSSKMLDPNEENLISMFYENYAIGPYFTKPSRGGTFKYTFGYKYGYMEAPQYITADNAIETISSTRHSAFIYTEWESQNKLKLTAESNYGITTFKKPNGEKITFTFPNVKNATADQFFLSSVKNTYSYQLNDYVLLQGNIGYSGYFPLMEQYYSSIAIMMAAEAYLYKQAFDMDSVPWLQAIAQILTSYLLVKAMDKDVFYSEIILGAQVGIKIDSAKWFK